MWGRAMARVHASADSPNVISKSNDGSEKPALIVEGSEEEEATSSSLSVVLETSAAGSASSLPLHQQPEPHTPPHPSFLTSPVLNGQRKLSIMGSRKDMSFMGVIMQVQANKRAHDFAKNWHSKWMERRSGIKPGSLDR